jgi:Co/Zn/Cd efflux system component
MTRPSSVEPVLGRIERAYRPTIFAIAALALSVMAGETLYGWLSGSRYLVRDGLEWIYDVLIYGFSALAFGRGARAERLSSLGSAATLAAAGVETCAQIAWTFYDPPEAETFGITLSSALTTLEAMGVAALLWRFRRASNPVMTASWLSARNDVLSSTLSSLVTAAARFAPTVWPQTAVDAFGAFLCFQAAWTIARDARADQPGGGT